MAKKPASFEYNGTLVRVLDGDTIDCYIDLGLIWKLKNELDIWVLILGKVELVI